jgi:hypothetical protein
MIITKRSEQVGDSHRKMEWQNLYAQMTIMVLGMGIKEARI